MLKNSIFHAFRPVIAGLTAALSSVACAGPPELGMPPLGTNEESLASSAACTHSSSATQRIGTPGGMISIASGVGVVIDAGTFGAPTNVSVSSVNVTGAHLPALPPGFRVLGVVHLDVAGGPKAPLHPFVPAPAGTDSVGYFAAQLVSLGNERKLSVIDTASIKQGHLTTNSPPFPGVRSSGDFAFIGVPAGTSMAGFSLRDAGSKPIPNATVAWSGEAPGFVGIAAPDGFAALPVPAGSVVLDAVAFAPDGFGSFSLGAASVAAAQLPELPIPQPVPALPEWLVKLGLTYAGVPIGEVPAQSKPCAIGSVKVTPQRIDDHADPFRVGDVQSISVQCDDLVPGTLTECSGTPSSSDLRAPLTGYETTAARYLVEGAPPPVEVIDDPANPERKALRAIAHGTGDVRIAVRKACLRRVKVGSVQSLVVETSLPAGATIDPIVVACKANEIWDGARCRQPQLAVQRVGEAARGGLATSAPGTSIDCGATCTGNVDLGAALTLEARSAPGANVTFAGWGADCAAAGAADTVSLAITGDTSCSAEFECGGGKAWDDKQQSCQCPAATPECQGKCVSTMCGSGQIFDQASCRCIASYCTSDWQLVTRSVLSVASDGSGSSGLLANYSDGTVVDGEGPIWFGPHEPGWVPSYYPADRLADSSAPALWQTISGLGGETLTGAIRGPRTGAVAFGVGCDDHCTISVAGLYDVEANEKGGVGGTVTMTEGTWYPITITYSNDYGTNHLSFQWQCP
jgi:hypothetical protein